MTLIPVEDKLSMGMISRNAKPVVRQGRKATGFMQTAGLHRITGLPAMVLGFFYAILYVDGIYLKVLNSF